MAREECELRRRVDLRYRGQSFELTVDSALNGERSPEKAWEETRERFAAAHLERYGYDRPGTPVELVSLRVEGHGPGAADLDELLPPIDEAEDDEPPAERGSFPTRPMIWAGSAYEAPQIPRERLRPGQSVSGPLLIHEFSATTVVPPGAGVDIGPWGDLLITLGHRGQSDG